MPLQAVGKRQNERRKEDTDHMVWNSMLWTGIREGQDSV